MRYLALLVVLLSSCCGTFEPSHIRPLINAASNATAELVEKRADGTYRPFCSAVWVSRDEMVTAAHCVDPHEDTIDTCMAAPDPVACILALGAILDKSPIGMTVNYSTWSDALLAGFESPTVAREAKVTRYDRAKDLAVLRTVNRSDHGIAPISKVDPQPGDPVHVMGHTLGFPWSYSPGVVGAVRSTMNPNDDLVHVVQVFSAASFGNSGGGLFNDAGELIGVCSFLLERAPMISFFIHRDVVEAFVQ